MLYANPVRTYNGKDTLFEAARVFKGITLRTDLSYGKGWGFWNGSPVWEAQSEPGTVVPEVAALTVPIHRDITFPVPLLFDAIKKSIADAWRPDAFHLVLHSSGWDSRIISGSIKQLLEENGPEWLGRGLLFLSNRWEYKNFERIMQAQGWAEENYAHYCVGDVDEHFSKFVYDVWKYGPLPRPGNFFFYLTDWAITEGLIPNNGVQMFTGLWANEAWHSFLHEPNHWMERVRKSYGIHMIAAMPARVQWCEYPLVSLPVLEIVRRTAKTYTDANVLREQVGKHACPEANQVKGSRGNDGGHPLSERLRKELGDRYKETEFGKLMEWEVPLHSANSTQWGRWSSALLVDKLIAGGAHIKGVR